MTAKSGIELIAAERQRQVEREGYDTHHDDLHNNYELSSAACCYAQMGAGGPYSHTRSGNPPQGWPWHADEWKPKRDPIKNLVRVCFMAHRKNAGLWRASRVTA